MMDARIWQLQWMEDEIDLDAAGFPLTRPPFHEYSERIPRGGQEGYSIKQVFDEDLIKVFTLDLNF